MKKQPRHYLILSDDAYERKKKEEEVIASLLPQDQISHGVTRLVATEVNEEVIARMKTLPFFVSHQVFVFTMIHKFKKKGMMLLETYCTESFDHTTIIFSGELDDERGLSCLVPFCEVIKVKNTPIADIRSVVYATLKRAHREMSPDAFDLLQERVGGSSAFLERALDTLLLSTHQGTRIEVDDVRDSIDSLLTYDIFDLTNAVAERNGERALEVVAYLVENGTHETELLGMICWQVRRLFEAQAMLGAGVPPADIGRKIRVNRYYLDRFLQQLKRFKKEELIMVLDELYRIDISMKQGKADARREIELLLVRLCTRQLM